MPYLFKYRIEIWNLKTKKYNILWQGQSEIIAQKMMDKPYNRTATRRLIKTEETIIRSEKAKK